MVWEIELCNRGEGELFFLVDVGWEHYGLRGFSGIYA